MRKHRTPKAVVREAEEARSGPRPWLFFFVGAAFYFYEFFARVAPGVLKNDILSVTGSTGGQFGLAMGMYFLAYAPAQLIIGRLLDRHGTRMVVAPAAVVVALGCLLLASADSLLVMGIGRFLQGLGSAVAYLGVVYLAMVWFPPRRHGIVPGLTVAMGTLGASTAEFPLSEISDSFGWRTPLYTCAGVGLAIACLLWFVLPKRPLWFIELMKEDGYNPDVPEPMMATFMRVAKNRQLWLLALASAGLYLPISVIGDLWGVNFLELETGMEPRAASLATTMVFIGFAVGGVGCGVLADRLRRRRVIFLSCAVVSTTAATLLLLANQQPVWLTVMLLGLLGLATGGQALAFVMAADSAARQMRGVQLAFVNFVTMLLPVAVQPGVGFLAEEGVSSTGEPSATQELRGFGLIVGLMLICTVIAFFVRETHPRKEPK
jgi:MFS family permease